MGVMSLSAHRAVEIIVGSALVIVPVLLQAPALGAVACVVLGALVLTLALSANHEGRALAGTGHLAADRLLAVVLAVLGLVLALSGDGGLAALSASAAVAQALLSLSTRYVVRPGRDDESQATTVTTST
jgi:hypothetical protein